MGSIAVVVPFEDRWYFAEVIRGVRDRADVSGHEVALSLVAPGSGLRAADVIKDVLRGPGVVGAVVAGFKSRPDSAARARELTRPVVLVGGSGAGLPAVMIDDIGAAREATEHLRSLGHSRITHLAGASTGQMDFAVHGRRARGYRQVMESAGLDVDIVEIDFDHGQALEATRMMLDRSRPPTAIFAVSDEIAFAVLEVARERGLSAGQQLSVVGIDDHPRAEAAGLSTIRQRPDQMGASAVDLLLSGPFDGPHTERSQLAPITLIRRSSTGSPRAADARPVSGSSLSHHR